MSAFDDWLAKNGKTRKAADALDEIIWLRYERRRLRLTDDEKWAINTILDCFVEGRGPTDPIRVGVVLQGLLHRHGEDDE